LAGSQGSYLILCKVLAIYRRGFAETSSLYLAVSNTQGFVRGICEMLSVGTLSLCGVPKSKGSTSEEVGRRRITHMVPAEG
jgi:hypothetical protein